MVSRNNLDSWDKFSGSYLKADMVKSDSDFFVCTNLNETEDDKTGNPKLQLILERENIELMFDLNKSNIQILKDLKVLAPKDLIGKKIFFNKVMARNPQLNKEVPSLRISKVE